MSPEVITLVLLLARVCFSEEGFNHDACVTITHALIEQAEDRRIPLRTQICRYAPNSCDRHRMDDRRFISRLHPDRVYAPPGMSQRRWNEFRIRFAALMVTAYRAYIGELYPTCGNQERLPYHWGAQDCTSCFRRMRRSGFRRLHCPQLANAWFWRP